MAEGNASSVKAGELWRRMLIDGHGPTRVMLRFFRLLPAPPRCKACYSPFGGIGGKVVGLFGFRRSRKNPSLCINCCEGLPRGGAEVDAAVLFADIRGSSRLAADVGPAEYARKLNHFYAAATEILVRRDAIIDKLIGDEVMALFLPGIAGKSYREKAVAAAFDLARAFGPGAPGAMGVVLGVAVHCGPAFVGNVGSSDIVDFTAVGETVNFAAHLQACAGPGEALVSETLYSAVAAHYPDVPSRDVVLKALAATVRVLDPRADQNPRA